VNNPTIISKPSIRLVGLKVRTSNMKESNSETAMIGKTIQKYYSLVNHHQPHQLMYSVYTDYESDHTGSYTYFWGHVATQQEEANKEFETLEIPSQTYLHYKTDAGLMPDIVIGAWQFIWKSEKDGVLFNKKRNYQADFELYGESQAPEGTAIVDIYIGIK
jgi:predicted transcriptional regulator YdeE